MPYPSILATLLPRAAFCLAQDDPSCIRAAYFLRWECVSSDFSGSIRVHSPTQIALGTGGYLLTLTGKASSSAACAQLSLTPVLEGVRAPACQVVPTAEGAPFALSLRLHCYVPSLLEVAYEAEQAVHLAETELSLRHLGPVHIELLTQ